MFYSLGELGVRDSVGQYLLIHLFSSTSVFLFHNFMQQISIAKNEFCFWERDFITLL